MGRGNICTYGQFEGLYYLDYDFIDAYRKIEYCGNGGAAVFNHDNGALTVKELTNIGIKIEYNGTNANWFYDEEASRDNWYFMVEAMQKALTKRFKSFSIADKWRDRDKHVVLENSFFQIAVVDNQWSAAWCLLVHHDFECDGRSRALMSRHYESYLEGIKTALVEIWGEAIGYGGAWISGARYTRNVA